MSHRERGGAGARGLAGRAGGGGRQAASRGDRRRRGFRPRRALRELAQRIGAEIDARSRSASRRRGKSVFCARRCEPEATVVYPSAPAPGRRVSAEPGFAAARARRGWRGDALSLLAGGKRIRPVLALATAEALRRPPADVLPLAAAHRDDPHLLADPRRPAGDGRRRASRGKPTCHVAYGEDVAILAGDGLFAEALRLC